MLFIACSHLNKQGTVICSYNVNSSAEHGADLNSGTFYRKWLMSKTKAKSHCSDLFQSRLSSKTPLDGSSSQESKDFKLVSVTRTITGDVYSNFFNHLYQYNSFQTPL